MAGPAVRPNLDEPGEWGMQMAGETALYHIPLLAI